MNILGPNKFNQNFTAYESETENKKTNAGKLIGTGVGVGYIASDIHSKGGLSKFVDEYNKEVAYAVKKEVAKTRVGNVDINNLNTSLFKRIAKVKCLFSIATVSATCIGIGAICDALINSRRGA